MPNLSYRCVFPVLLAWPLLAAACRPQFVEPAGFIHADVATLPANAKGALFLPPSTSLQYLGEKGANVRIYAGAVPALVPADFRIISSLDDKPLPVKLTWLEGIPSGAAPPAWRAYRFASQKAKAPSFYDMKEGDVARLLEQGVLQDITAQARALETQIVRVGPPGGFQPGVHYMITYVGPGAGQGWRYPEQVSHVIGTLAAPKGAVYGLELDGPPTRRWIHPPDAMCDFDGRAALVQDFHYVPPSDLAQYVGAVMYASEVDGGNPGARPGRSGYAGALPYGRVSQGEGREFAYWSCPGPGVTASIGGWAGMLEVDDQMSRVPARAVTLSGAQGPSCAELTRQTSAPRAWQTTACDAAIGLAPTPAQLLALARTARPETQRCAKSALAAWIGMAPEDEEAVLAGFLGMVSDELHSADPGRVREALSMLGYPGKALAQTSEAKRQAFLTSLLPALDHVVASQNRAVASLAVVLIKQVGVTAYVPSQALRARARSRQPEASTALDAWAAMAPHDPELPAKLIKRSRP